MAVRAPDRAGTSPLLQLQIEELILHGFAPADRHRVAGAIERELHRLLSRPDAGLRLRQAGGPSGAVAVNQMDAGAFLVPHGATPDAVGIQVAQAIFRSLAPGRGAAAHRAGSTPPATAGGRR